MVPLTWLHTIALWQAHVDEILVENGRACGVRLSNGTIVRASEAGPLCVCSCFSRWSSAGCREWRGHRDHPGPCKEPGGSGHEAPRLRRMAILLALMICTLGHAWGRIKKPSWIKRKACPFRVGCFRIAFLLPGSVRQAPELEQFFQACSREEFLHR